MSGLRFLALLVFVLVAGAALAVNPMTRYVVTINDRPMISLRDFAETFDADVDYHIDRDEFCITLYDTTVYLVPYRMTAWVNERKVWLDIPVVIIDDVTYLPVKFLCEAFGFRYEWGQPNREVCIVNRWTTETIVFVFDIEWSNHRHVWRHDYDCHWYINYHHHKTDWARRDANPPYHHHDYADNDSHPGDRQDGYKDADRTSDGHGGYTDRPYDNGHGGYTDRPYDGKPDNKPTNDRRDEDVDHGKLPGRPPMPTTNGPVIDTPRPYGDMNPRPDYDRPNPGEQHGDYRPQPGQPGGYEPQPGQPDGKDNSPWWRRDQQPDGKDNGPSWRRDQQPAGNMPSVFEWLGKKIEIKPYDDNPNGGGTPQNNQPQPEYNHQDKEQSAQPQDNDRHEKESKDQGESKEKSNDSGEKEGKSSKHRDK